jgi:SAM-dependent methyltransferase
MTAKTTHEEEEYILGTDRAELERLRFQHEVWVAHTHRLWARAGFGEGQAVADLGSGPGFTTFDLALVTGARGKVIACEISPRFASYLRAEAARRGLSQVEVREGAVEELALAPASLDAAYARWLFCWLRDPGLALGRVAKALRPGGRIALQEYLDWAAMQLVPASPIFERAVAACMRSWHDGGGTIDLARRLPALAAEHGLEVEHFEPVSRAGRVGSLEARWMGQFFAAYLPKLAAAGRFAAADLELFLAELRDREREGSTWFVTPTMTDVILRKR